MEKFSPADTIEKATEFQNIWIEDVKTLVSTFQSDVVKCWWQGKEDACNNMFINRFTDTNYCFCLNPGNKLAKEENLWKLFGGK